jgi:hypothetical protein
MLKTHKLVMNLCLEAITTVQDRTKDGGKTKLCKLDRAKATEDTS